MSTDNSENTDIPETRIVGHMSVQEPQPSQDTEPEKITLHTRRGTIVFDELNSNDLNIILFDDFLGIRVQSNLDGFMHGAPFDIHDHRDGVVAFARIWDQEEDPEKKDELYNELLEFIQNTEALICIRRRIDHERKTSKTYVVLKEVASDRYALDGAQLVVTAFMNNQDFNFSVKEVGLYCFRSISSNRDGNETLTIFIALCDGLQPLHIVEIDSRDVDVVNTDIVYNSDYSAENENEGDRIAS